jgi:hypothetical protein
MNLRLVFDYNQQRHATTPKYVTNKDMQLHQNMLLSRQLNFNMGLTNEALNPCLEHKIIEMGGGASVPASLTVVKECLHGLLPCMASIAVGCPDSNMHVLRLRADYSKHSKDHPLFSISSGHQAVKEKDIKISRVSSTNVLKVLIC